MRILRKTSKLLAMALCGLWINVVGTAQSPGLSVSPPNPTLSVGQTQQFTASGTVTATGISAGGEYTCVGLSNGTAQCTGRNQFGQHADGTLNNSSVLVPNSLANVARVVAGDEFGCALLQDATVSCWGLGESGQRGDGTFITFSPNPAVVAGLTGVAAVASGYSHACALLSDGSMRCWGGNTNGELGNGTTSPSAVPVAVNGIANAVA